MVILSAEEVLQKFKDEFKDKILDSHIKEQQEGCLKKVTQKIITIRIGRDIFYRAIKFLKSISFPHITTSMNHRIYETEIELMYFLNIFGGNGEVNYSEIPVLFEVMIPKDDFRVPTITDLIPGGIIMEREAIEMLGVTIDNIPDSRRMFTPDNLDEIEKGMLPMRSDLGFGIEDFYKKRKGEVKK